MAVLERIPRRYEPRIRLMGLPLELITEGRWAGWHLGPAWVLPLLELVGRPLDPWTPPDAPIHHVDWDGLFRRLASTPELGPAVAALLLLDDDMTPNQFIDRVSPLVEVPLFATREIGAAKRVCQTAVEAALHRASQNKTPVEVSLSDFEGIGLSVSGSGGSPMEVRKLEAMPDGTFRLSTRNPVPGTFVVPGPKKTP